MESITRKSTDPAVNYFLPKANQKKVALCWDRYENQQPLCGFGELSLCCQACWQGPCRIHPFNEKFSQTICGKNGDDLVAMRFAQIILSGASHDFQRILSLSSFLNQISSKNFSIIDEAN